SGRSWGLRCRQRCTRSFSALTTKAWQSSWTSTGSSPIRWGIPGCCFAWRTDPMSDSPNRGRRYQPQQGQGSYGPPPPYQGPQGQPQRNPRQQWQDQGWGQQPTYDQAYTETYGADQT